MRRPLSPRAPHLATLKKLAEQSESVPTHARVGMFFIFLQSAGVSSSPVRKRSVSPDSGTTHIQRPVKIKNPPISSPNCLFFCTKISKIMVK